MTENWDFYLCAIEEKPASILVDLGLVEHAPVPQFSYMGYVNIFLQNPDEHGFPHREEYDSLVTIEDALTTAITAHNAAIYAGRCSTAGHCDLMFYTTALDGWESKITAVMEQFSAYTWETGIHEEPEWETYMNFLFPEPQDLVAIQNRRVCHQLEEQGDDLTAVRPIDHWVAFTSQAEALDFCAEISEFGYIVEESPEDPERAPVYAIRLSRADTPDAIDEISFTLCELVRKYNGVYDGWGCAVVL